MNADLNKQIRADIKSEAVKEFAKRLVSFISKGVITMKNGMRVKQRKEDGNEQRRF